MAKTKVSVSFFPVVHVPRAELDGLAARAALGDREAEAAVLSDVTPIILNVVTKLVAHFRLERRKEELLQDGLLEATRIIRRYRPGKSHFPAFLTFSLSKVLLRTCRSWWSPAGCHVAGGCRSLDFQSPAFSGTAAVATGAGEDETGHNPAARPAEDPAAEERQVRHRLMNRLRKLTPFEKEVLARHWGLRLKPSTRDRWCREAARRLRPESLDEIAADFEVSRETIRVVQGLAMTKLGILDLPKPAPRVMTRSVAITLRSNNLSTSAPFQAPAKKTPGRKHAAV